MLTLKQAECYLKTFNNTLKGLHQNFHFDTAPSIGFIPFLPGMVNYYSMPGF